MKKMPVKLIAVASLFLASVAFGAQDTHLIRRKLVEGEKVAYSTVSVTQQTVEMPNGMGDQEMSMKVLGTYNLLTGKVNPEKGTAELTLVYTVDKTETDGPLANAMNSADAPKRVETKGTIDVRGKTVMDAPKIDKATASMFAAGQSTTSSLFAFELPEKAVKVGDTWEVVIPKTPFTSDKDQKITAKLVGEKVVDGKAVYEVSAEGTINVDVDLSKVMKEGPMAGQKMLVKGTVQNSTTGLLDKETGAPISLKMVLKSKQTVEIPDMNVNMAMAGTTTIELKRKD